MNHCLKLAGAAVLIAAQPVFAEIKLSEYVSISGYAVGAYTNTDFDPGSSEDTFLDSGANNFDSAKVALTAGSGPFSATASVFWIPEFTGDDNEVGILDAYASYTVGELTFTGGKFLSYLGYEAFDAANMSQISYALISGIPAYHTGAKVDWNGEGFSTGFAVVDSVNPGSGFFQGDGEFSDDVGIEAYFVYKGTENLTAFFGIATEDTDGAANNLNVFDFWISYALTPKLTLAAEYTVNSHVAESWLAFAQYAFTEKFFVVGRVSGIDYDSGGDAFKVTIAPTVVINEYLSVRAEYSNTNDMVVDSDFYGIQAVVRF